MKRFLIILGLLFIGLKTYADAVEFEPVTTKGFWPKTGVYEEKVLDVGGKLINSNKIDKRVILRVIRKGNVVNATADPLNKHVNIYLGLIPYLDNDDELAFIIGHETAHCLDFYDGGLFKAVVTMRLNSKAYEYKADLIGVDLMTKAGYNPIAAITAQNKVLNEAIWDSFFFTTHPKGSKRLMAIYKYIYRKYPWALDTDMVNNVNYRNFVNSSQKEINEFLREDKERSKKRGESL